MVFAARKTIRHGTPDTTFVIIRLLTISSATTEPAHIMREKFDYESPKRFDFEPSTEDSFDENAWELLAKTVSGAIPTSVASFLRRHGGHYVAAPIGHYDAESDLVLHLDQVYGSTGMQKAMRRYRLAASQHSVIPVLQSPELLYVTGGPLDGRIVDGEFFMSGDSLQDIDDWDAIPWDEFLEGLVYDWELLVSEVVCANDREAALAACRGEWPLLKRRLDNGMWVDKPLDSDGKTLLWYAASANQAEIIERLLEFGADVNKLMTIGEDDPCNPQSVLVVIAAQGVKLSAARALLEGGADVTRRVSNGHPWFPASEEPRKEMLSLLESYGFMR